MFVFDEVSKIMYLKRLRSYLIFIGVGWKRGAFGGLNATAHTMCYFIWSPVLSSYELEVLICSEASVCFLTRLMIRPAANTNQSSFQTVSQFNEG